MRFYKKPEHPNTVFFTSKFFDGRFYKLQDLELLFGRTTPDAWYEREKFAINLEVPRDFYDIGLGVFTYYEGEYYGDFGQLEIRLILINIRLRWRR